MRKHENRWVSLASLVAIPLVAVSAGAAMGQEKFPAQPISVIISWAPGGASHNDAVLLQPLLSKQLGVPVEIVNKPGGNGTIGWNYVANSKPDGYTLAQTNPSLVFTRYTTKTGISDDNFTHLTVGVKIPYALAVKAESPWKTFDEFIAHAKQNPGKVQMGVTGLGTTVHVGTLGIEMVTGAKFISVPFKGAGPIFTAILGGHVSGTFAELTAIMPFVEADKLRVLAISDAQRSPVLPNVPTLKELGYELLIGTWQGYSVPKGTPPDRVRVLSEALKAAMSSEDYQAYYRKQGGTIMKYEPETVGAFYANEEKTIRSIVQHSGFKPAD